MKAYSERYPLTQAERKGLELPRACTPNGYEPRDCPNFRVIAAERRIAS
jgi:hypothetical protein